MVRKDLRFSNFTLDREGEYNDRMYKAPARNTDENIKQLNIHLVCDRDVAESAITM